MEIPVDKWYKAIFKRKSRRKYLSKPLTKKSLKELRDVAKQLGTYFSETRLEVVEGECDKVFKGIIGSYGAIKGAPAFVAFIGQSGSTNLFEKIGYIGEAFILEATAKNLGTCWVGGSFDESKAAEYLELAEGEKVLAVSPLGYTGRKNSLSEKLISRLASSHRRKGLDELCERGYNEKWPEWIKTSLECARLAPSAINRQPWSFQVKEDSIIISVRDIKKGNIPVEIDCGIALLHLEVGARFKGADVQWDFLKGSQIARIYV